MTANEQREAARQFYYIWRNRGDEKSDSQSYWLTLLTNVLCMDDTANRVVFEKRVLVNGQTKFIDVLIPESRVLIEQKSLKKDLSKLYPDSSLAVLYNEVTMQPELRKAHNANNIGVMQAYGFPIRNSTEESCITALMEMYQEHISSDINKQ